MWFICQNPICLYNISIMLVLEVDWKLDINYNDIGKRIRNIRIKQKMTQRKLADKIDKTSTHVSHIENGTTKLSLIAIVDIANALNTTVDRLLCDNINNSNNEYACELSELISGCSPLEMRFIIEITKPALDAFRRAEQAYKISLEDY